MASSQPICKTPSRRVFRLFISMGSADFISRAVVLSSRTFRDALPAWHRVPKVAAQQPGRRRGTIMKRLTSPYEQRLRCPPTRLIPWWDSGKEQGQQHPAQRRRLHGGLGEESDVLEAQFAEEKKTSDDYTEAIGEYTWILLILFTC